MTLTFWKNKEAPMDREIGIGIVGCGSIARWKYAENLASLPGCCQYSSMKAR